MVPELPEVETIRRQLEPEIGQVEEDGMLRTIARLDGVSFPSISRRTSGSGPLNLRNVSWNSRSVPRPAANHRSRIRSISMAPVRYDAAWVGHEQ